MSDPTETPPIPMELVRAGATGRLCVVMGPGVATESGFPTVDETLRFVFVRALDEAPSERRNDLEEARTLFSEPGASRDKYAFLSAIMGEPFVDGSILAMLRTTRAEPTRLHRALADLPAMFVATGPDELLQGARMERGAPVLTAFVDDGDDIRVPSDGDILALGGTLSKSSLLRFARPPLGLTEKDRRRLEQAFARISAILLVGFDVRDEELTAVLDIIAGTQGDRPPKRFWLAARDARIRARAAALQIEPLWLPLHRDAEWFVRALTERIGRRDAERTSMWPLPEDTLDATKIALEDGHRALAMADLAQAAEYGMAVCGKHAPEKEPQLVLEGLAILYFALRRTLFEEPPDAKFVPVERRGEVLEVLEKGLTDLAGVEGIWRFRAFLLAERFGSLTIDVDTWIARFGEVEGANGDTNENPFESRDWPAIKKAMDLAEKGQVEEGLAQLPHFDHPWKGGFYRALGLLIGKQLERGLIAILELCRDRKGCTQLDEVASRWLLVAARHDEALEHAARAFAAFPSRGNRALLGEVYAYRGQNHEAWNLLGPLSDSPNIHLIGIRATVASAVAPNEASELFAKYLDAEADNTEFRLLYARHEARMGRLQMAANIAWQLVSEPYRAKLSAEQLYGIAQLQVPHEELTADEFQRRIQIIVGDLGLRFVGDEHAGRMQRAILLRLATPNLSIRRALDVPSIPEPMIEGLPTRETLREGYEDFGGPSFERLCILWKQSPRALFDTLLRRDAHRILPALGLVNLFMGQLSLDLGNVRLMVGALELCIIDELELWDSLANALAPHGLLILFQDIADSIMAVTAETSGENRLARAVANGIAANWVVVITRFVADAGSDTAHRNALARQFTFSIQRELAYYQALSEDSTLRLLCADSTIASPQGALGKAAALSTTPPEHGPVSLEDKIAHFSARLVSMAEVVRSIYVADENTRLAKLVQLAELGFADALGPSELLALSRRHGGIDREEPARILIRAERLARKAQHIAQESACDSLARAHAQSIWEATCGKDPWPETEARSLAIALLLRADEIDSVVHTTMLERIFEYLSRATVAFPIASTTLGPSNLPIIADYSPAGRLWDHLAGWCGGRGRRAAALRRAFAKTWLAIDTHTQGNGPGSALAGPLFVGTFRAGILPGDGTLGALNAPLILSATWKEQPFGDSAIQFMDPISGDARRYPLKQLLPHITAEISRSASFMNEAACLTQLSVPNSSAVVRISVRPEAALLCLEKDKLKTNAVSLALMQGLHDGRAYLRLCTLATNPEDPATRKGCARDSVLLPFVLVREDPTILATWMRYPVAGFPQGIDELCAMLSEPIELKPDEHSLGEILESRIQDLGLWQHRLDGSNLYNLATQVPGAISILPLWLQWPQNAVDFGTLIMYFLQVLDQPNEHAVGRISTAIFFLRLVAEHIQHVALPQGNVDIRERLPERLVSLLDTVEKNPQDGTLAAYEAGLLRLCALQVKRLDPDSRLSQRHHLWLTYRLFQWVVAQLEALTPTAKMAAFESLARSLPGPSVDQASDDLLDPLGFDRVHGIDHRLVTVLYALSQMNHVVKQGDDDGQEKPAVAPWRFSSPMLEERFAKLAGRPLTKREGRLRSRGQTPTSFDWDAPGTLPDLAVLALVTSRREGFARIAPDERLRWIHDLPAGPMDTSHTPWFVARSLYPAINAALPRLTPEEARGYEGKLRLLEGEAKSEPLRWRWLGLTSLFRAGKGDISEPEILDLLIAHLDAKSSPKVFGWALLGVARRNADHLEPFIQRVLDTATERGLDPVPLVEGITFVLTLSKVRPAIKKAREIMLALETRPPFQGDDRMHALVAQHGVR